MNLSTRRALGLLATLVLTLGLVAGCSSDDGDGAARTEDSQSTDGEDPKGSTSGTTGDDTEPSTPATDDLDPLCAATVALKSPSSGSDETPIQRSVRLVKEQYEAAAAATDDAAMQAALRAEIGKLAQVGADDESYPTPTEPDGFTDLIISECEPAMIELQTDGTSLDADVDEASAGLVAIKVTSTASSSFDFGLIELESADQDPADALADAQDAADLSRVPVSTVLKPGADQTLIDVLPEGDFAFLVAPSGGDPVATAPLTVS